MNNILSILSEQLEPLLLRQGFSRCKRGYYVRMCGDILQYMYFSLGYHPFGIRFGALPYWAAEESWLQKKHFDFLGYHEVHEVIDAVERHTDREQYFRDPSYRRWDYKPNDQKDIQRVAELYKIKIPLFIFPILDNAIDFNSYVGMQEHLLNILNEEKQKQLDSPSISRFIVFDYNQRAMMYECIKKKSFDWLKNELKHMETTGKKRIIQEVKGAEENLQGWIAFTMENWEEMGRTKAQTDEELKRLQNELNRIQSRTTEEIDSIVEKEYRDFLQDLRNRYYIFYDAIEKGASPDIFVEEIMTYRTKMRQAVKTHLNLQVARHD